MAESPETVSLTEYFPCRTDTAPADSRSSMNAGHSSETETELKTRSYDAVSDADSPPLAILERMHTVSSTETSGYVDAASSPTAVLSSPSLIPCGGGGGGGGEGGDVTMVGTFFGGDKPSGTVIVTASTAAGSMLLSHGNRHLHDCYERPVHDGVEGKKGDVFGKGCQFKNISAPGGRAEVYVKVNGQRNNSRSCGKKFRRRSVLDRKRRDQDEEDEDEDEEEEEETSSSSEDDDEDDDDDDYWQREDSSMFTRKSNPRPCFSGASNTLRSDALTAGPAESSKEGGQGQFLGKATQSAWLKWSHERRASFKRRVEFMEQRQTELQRIRLSSPIRKARKESVRFVAKELEQEHLAPVIDPVGVEEVSLYGHHPAFPFDIPPSTKKSQPRKGTGETTEVATRLSLSQWNTLVAFWEHKLFVKLRCCGLLLELVALSCAISSLANNKWSTYENHTVYGAAEFSLWKICSCEQYNCSSIEHTKWQISVIGLVFFSTTFGSLGIILSLGGFFTSSLPRKIYYYHSAGEIDLLCCISCVVTSVIYPLTVESERLRQGSSHEFGLGYFLVCSSASGFCLAASCLCLDDMIRSLAKLFCRRTTQRSYGKLQIFRLFQSKS